MAKPIAHYSNYIQAMRSIGAKVDRRGRGLLARGRGGPDEIGDGDGPVSPAEHLHLVVGLVRAGIVDLRRRRPGLLEAAGRRLRPALLLALHRDGRRLHGGISLDGDRRRAAADLSVRRSSRCSCRWSACTSTWSSPGPIRSSSGAPRRVLAALYGVPSLYLGALWASMLRARLLGERSSPLVDEALRLVSRLALGYVGLAVVIFGVCIVCLVASFVSAPTRSERNQVQWILLAALLSTLPIGYLSCQTLSDPSNLGRDSTAWPMFGVSLLFTLAYAMSITRYKLMQVEEIINRSVVYFVLSVTAGLVYSGVLLLGGKVIGDQLLSGTQTSGGAMVAALTAIVVLILSELARRAVPEGDRPAVLPREVQVRPGDGEDEAGHRQPGRSRDAGPSAAGGGRRGPAAGVGGDLPRRLARGGRSGWWRATGPPPTSRCWPGTIRWSPGSGPSPPIRVPHAMSSSTASDPATDAMIALGGEVGQCAGGRRRPGRPARARPEAERDALRGRGDRLPRRAQLGRDAGARTRRGSSRPWRSSTTSCATRSRRSPSSSGGS